MTDNQNLIRIFEYALNQEQTGKSFFETSLKRMECGASASAFQQLIHEEENHIRFISEILDGLKHEKPDPMEVIKEQGFNETNYFDERAKSESLETRLYESMVPDATVFSVAWLIEKDISEFYDRMAHQTEGQAKEAFKMLADWEKGHERFFREYRDKLMNIYSKMSWGG